MAFSNSLAERIRSHLAGRQGVTEKKMFGGIVFLLNGNMLVGVWEESLIVRIGIEQAEHALKQPYVRPFDVTGRPMKGWAMVDADGTDSDVALRSWIDLAWDFVRTLPGK